MMFAVGNLHIEMASPAVKQCLPVAAVVGLGPEIAQHPPYEVREGVGAEYEGVGNVW